MVGIHARWALALAVLAGPACTVLEPLGYALLNSLPATELAADGDRLYLMGDLNSRSLGQVRKALAAHPEVTTLVLTACPGSIDDETLVKIGRLVRSRGLDTHLLESSVIASGAVDLFLAGVSRTMEKGAVLGVHSWADTAYTATDVPRDHPDHALYVDYVNEMLGGDAFYWFTIDAAPADGIHWMTSEEVSRYGLLTAPVLPPSHATTPFGGAFVRARADVLSD